MAFNQAPSPVLVCKGTLRSSEFYKTGERSTYGPDRDAARVQVLTDDGGFIEVYVDPDHAAEVRQLGTGSQIAWAVEVGVFTRTSQSGSKWSSLSARMVRDLDAAPVTDSAALANLRDSFAGSSEVEPEPSYA